MNRMALKIWTSKSTARVGSCFRVLFGIPLVPGALPTLRPLMVSRTSSGATRPRAVLRTVILFVAEYGSTS